MQADRVTIILEVIGALNSQMTSLKKPRNPHTDIFTFPVQMPRLISLPCGFDWGSLQTPLPYGDGDQRDGTVYLANANKKTWTIPFVLSVGSSVAETSLPETRIETLVKEIVALVVTVIEEHEISIPLQGEHDYEQPRVVGIDFNQGAEASPHPLLKSLENRIYFVSHSPKPITSFDPDQTDDVP